MVEKKTLKNYTTSIKIEKTISEIESRLVKFGASHIFKIYDNGAPIGLAFTLDVQGQSISYKLPMREEKIMLVFNNQYKKGNLPKRYNDLEQARRTGWRIIRDWIDSQLALIEIEMAKPEEIFLQYMYDNQSNETFFEKIEKRGFDNLLE